MIDDELEKLKLLANDSNHLAELLIQKKLKEAQDLYGHTMTVVYKDYMMGFFRNFYSYCNNCSYEILIEIIPTDKIGDRLYTYEEEAKKRFCR